MQVLGAAKQPIRVPIPPSGRSQFMTSAQARNSALFPQSNTRGQKASVTAPILFYAMTLGYLTLSEISWSGSA